MQLGNSVKQIQPFVLLCVSVFLSQLPASAQDAAQAPASSTVSDAQVEANVLKALVGAPQLANEKISTTTVYGEVTLSGSVRDEHARVLAETLASRATGVKKVIDELTLSTELSTEQSLNSAQQPPQYGPAAGISPNPQSDGTTAPPPGDRPSVPAPAPLSQAPPRPYGPGAPEYRPGYPGQPGQPYTPGRAPVFNVPAQAPPYGAQLAGVAVVVPNGTMVRIRINQGLDSKHSQRGATFDGTVVNDVVADGAVAIPRGATVQGSVVDAKSSGSLGGHGELQLQLTHVVLAGKVFPITSDHWSSVGPSKTAHTVSNAIGLGSLGALIGAVAGGGPGAAIGATAGAAAGLGTSAASTSAQALIPPEAILTFHLAQPASVTTVSQAEMDRLGYGVPFGSQQPVLVRRSVYPNVYPTVYYGPGYPVGPYPGYNPYP